MEARFTPHIGILALQGDFAEHQSMVEQCGNVRTTLVKHACQLDDVDGLIIPGGESTAIARLTADSGQVIFDAIRTRASAGMPLYGTCMGAVVLARDIEGSSQGRLALMDITIRRNAFGPQKFSREQSLVIPELGQEPFPLVFIRAPLITSCGPEVAVLAQVDEGSVMVRQANFLATSFHPELTSDTRVHKYFLQMVSDYAGNRESPKSAVTAGAE